MTTQGSFSNITGGGSFEHWSVVIAFDVIAFDTRLLFPEGYHLPADDSLEHFCRFWDVHLSTLKQDTEALVTALESRNPGQVGALSQTESAVLTQKLLDLGNPFHFSLPAGTQVEMGYWLTELWSLRGSKQGLECAIRWLLRMPDFSVDITPTMVTVTLSTGLAIDTHHALASIIAFMKPASLGYTIVTPE